MDAPEGPALDVRAETPADWAEVANVHNLAFGGPAEAAIVEKLRGKPGSISMVALEAGEVVGHVLFSAASLGDVRVCVLGPMAVSPNRQRRGIGTLLAQLGLEACQEAGYEAVVVIGHPEYHPRFGFVPARGFGLECGFDVPDDVFMAMELRPGALGAGFVAFAPEFLETKSREARPTRPIA